MDQLVGLNYLRTVVNRLCSIVDQLGSSFAPPRTVPHGDGFVDRHHPTDRTNGLVCYLKAVKASSTLNGNLTLLGPAQVQEAHALGRIVQDAVEDIQFLLIPRGRTRELRRGHAQTGSAQNAHYRRDSAPSVLQRP